MTGFETYRTASEKLIAQGWYAGLDDDGKWQPSLQLNGIILELPIWFDSKPNCDEFIRMEIIGRGLIVTKP